MQGPTHRKPIPPPAPVTAVGNGVRAPHKSLFPYHFPSLFLYGVRAGHPNSSEEFLEYLAHSRRVTFACHEVECELLSWNNISLHPSLRFRGALLFLKTGFRADVKMPDLRTSPREPGPCHPQPPPHSPSLSVTHAASWASFNAHTSPTWGLAPPSSSELRASCLSPVGEVRTGWSYFRARVEKGR